MKKTIIASAVAAAVAAPAAFADVKIGGMVNPEMVMGESTDELRVQTDLVFSGSEDLGNGLKASFKYHLVNDTADSTTAADAGTQVLSVTAGAAGADGIPTVTHTVNSSAEVNGDTTVGDSVADLTVTLSGDFGSIAVGRQEGFAEGVGDAFYNIDAAHELDLELGDSVYTRKNGSIKYVSPSFNGLKVGVNSVELAGDTDSQTELMAQYSNNGLGVTLISSDNDNSANDYQIVNVSYKMGDLELRASAREYGNEDTTMIGAKYSMGANTIAIGSTNNDTSTNDETIVSASHSLSKNTSVYVVFSDAETAAGADNDTTIVGLRQKF